MRPPIAARFASCRESLPSVAETFVLSSVVNLYGSEPVWSTSARFFASPNEPMPGDLGVAADAVRERAVRVVDLRPRLDLAVEHDREVLRRLLQAAALVETLA